MQQSSYPVGQDDDDDNNDNCREVEFPPRSFSAFAISSGMEYFDRICVLFSKVIMIFFWMIHKIYKREIMIRILRIHVLILRNTSRRRSGGGMLATLKFQTYRIFFNTYTQRQ